MIRAIPAMFTLTFLSLFAAQSLAAVITYTDRSLFMGITNSVSATGGALPNRPLTPSDITRGTITFRHGPSTNNHGFINFNSLMPGREYAVSGPENFRMSLSSPVTAFGMDIVEPTCSSCGGGGVNATFVNSRFRFFLQDIANGLGTLATVDFSPPNNRLLFFGFTSTQAFDRIVVREISGASENEFFNNFVSSETFGVPIAASWPFIMTGLVGFACLRSRRFAHRHNPSRENIIIA